MSEDDSAHVDSLKSPLRRMVGSSLDQKSSGQGDVVAMTESFSTKLCLDKPLSTQTASKVFSDLVRSSEESTPKNKGTRWFSFLGSPRRSSPASQPSEDSSSENEDAFHPEEIITSSPRKGTESSDLVDPISPSGSSLFSPGFPHDQDQEKDETESQDSDVDVHISEDMYEAAAFIVSLPKKKTGVETKIKKNPNAPRLTLVLDLDETLVHCMIGKFDHSDHSFVLNVPGRPFSPLEVSVWWRPHLFEFLERIQGRYEVILFTASQKIYADTLLDVMDPERKVFDHRLFRDSCRLVNGSFIKDLDVINRDLATTIIVDNAPQAYAYNVSNGYPIPSWYDDSNDRALLDLLVFLDEHFQEENVTDIRTVIRDTFPLYRLVQKYSLDQNVE